MYHILTQLASILNMNILYQYRRNDPVGARPVELYDRHHSHELRLYTFSKRSLIDA